MARSIKSGSSNESNISKSKVKNNLGVYIFIDESGNVTQIKKEKRTRDVFNITDEVTLLDEYYVIGVSDTDPMGIGDDLMAWAVYGRANIL